MSCIPNRSLMVLDAVKIKAGRSLDSACLPRAVRLLGEKKISHYSSGTLAGFGLPWTDDF